MNTFKGFLFKYCLGYPAYTSQPAFAIVIHDNLLLDIDGSKWNADGRVYQILTGAQGLAPPHDIVINHNSSFTKTGAGAIIYAGDTASFGAQKVVFTNNISSHAAYGIFGGGVGEGSVCINSYFPNSTFADNLIGDAPGGTSSSYPAGFYFPSSWASVFSAPYSSTNYNVADYKSVSSYATTDSKPIGANIDLIYLRPQGFNN